MSKIVNKRIGFLVTGSEVTSGEILNSNSARMAEMLQEWGVKIGEHILCDDQPDHIEASLLFLLDRHEAIIVSGGLGPTSDDVTRNAVAKVADQALVFHAPSWQKIRDRLSIRNLPITENNKQQAFFPAQATVLKNEHGTADACFLTIAGKLVFMLPGPPRECLPLFEQQVFPILKEKAFHTDWRLFRWRLMGVSESLIAATLEPIAAAFPIEFAFRANYPFVDVKLMLNPQHKNHNQILLAVEKAVKPYFATHLKINPTQQLHDLLVTSQRTLFVQDEATQGYFMRKLNLPLALIALDKQAADIKISIHGLRHFWDNNANNVQDKCQLEVSAGDKPMQQFSQTLLLRGQESLDYVAEFAALKILSLL